VFDQTSTLGYPGSSGGGVYLKENGACVGLLTRGMGPGLNFIVPARRLKTWAAAVGVMWALDPSVAMPTAAERAQLPLDDGTAKDSVQNVIIIRSNPGGDIEVVPVEPDEEPADNSATGSGERRETIEAPDRSLPGVSKRVAHLLHLSRTA